MAEKIEQNDRQQPAYRDRYLLKVLTYRFPQPRPPGLDSFARAYRELGAEGIVPTGSRHFPVGADAVLCQPRKRQIKQMVGLVTATRGTHGS